MKVPAPKTLALIALMALVIGGGAVYLQYQGMVEAQGKADALALEVPDENQLQADLQAAKLKVIEDTKQLNHLEMGVPTIAYIPTLLREIEQLGIGANLRVTGVRPILPTAAPPGQAQEKKAYQELAIEISGRGSYQSVISTIDSLRTFPKIVSVETVNLTPKMKGDSPTYEHIETTIRIKAFVFPNPGEGTSAGIKPA